MTTLATDLYLLVAAYGLAVAVSYAGLPVLGQGAFVAVGAFGTSQLAAHGVPLGVAVITAVAMAGGGRLSRRLRRGPARRCARWRSRPGRWPGSPTPHLSCSRGCPAARRD